MEMIIRGHFPVPAGCRHRNFVPPKLVFDGGGYRNCFWSKGVSNQGFLRGGKNRGQRGHRGDPPVSQEGRWRGLGLGRARHPLGCLVVALLPCLGYFGSFRSADFLYNFSGIFGALLMAGKPEIQKQQKTTTGSWMHWVNRLVQICSKVYEISRKTWQSHTKHA